MAIIHYCLDIYFAAVLGIAGITKIDDPQTFVRTLNNYSFPKWGIPILQRTFPWVEVICAFFLLITFDVSKLVVAFLLLILFISFLFLNVSSFIRNAPDKNCGCYGRALQHEERSTKVITTFIQTLFTIVLLLLVIQTKPLPSIFYIISSLLFVIVLLWLLYRVWQKNNMPLYTNRGSLAEEGQIEPS